MRPLFALDFWKSSIVSTLPQNTKKLYLLNVKYKNSRYFKKILTQATQQFIATMHDC